MIADVADDGAIRSLTGDPHNEFWAGYSCIKGRTQHEFMRSPNRLLHSMKRGPDGSFTPVNSERAMDEVAETLLQIVGRHGPRSVAGYFGSMAAVGSNLTVSIYDAFMKALGSPMNFNPDTIDKPGKKTAKAFHGSWMAPRQGYDRPDVALLIGVNPFQSYYGVACGHPNRWLSEQLRNGMQLVVIDPRTSDIAKRATLHIQPAPGHDTAILAAILHVILTEELYDRAFVDEHTVGLQALAEQVAAFNPQRVAALADVGARDLYDAAHIFANADRGYVAAGVGPNMTESGTLVEYLVLNLEAICGRYLRAGERVHRVPTLLEPVSAKAQAAPPRPAVGFGHSLRVHGLGEMAAGMPTGGLTDEILLEGEGQVRVLLSVGGNPVSAWPDQLKVINAMESLDLLVQVDPWISSTARYADYVIAPTMPMEVPAASLMVDFLHVAGYFYGPEGPFAHYTTAVARRPEGSDLLEEWEFFYGLAQRMGLQLQLAGFIFAPQPPQDIDMVNKPSSEQLIDMLASSGVLSLAEVKQHPHGISYRDNVVTVAAKDPGWEGRLDLANPTMMSDLADLSRAAEVTDGTDASEFPFRLICRRMQRHFNSTWIGEPTNRGRGYNPAYMHPLDLDDLGLAAGDAIELSSARATIPAVVEPDPSLRRGLVSMANGYGDSPDRDGEFRDIGSPVGRLLVGTDFIDRYTGQPRMSNIPVAIRPMALS